MFDKKCFCVIFQEKIVVEPIFWPIFYGNYSKLQPPPLHCIGGYWMDYRTEPKLSVVLLTEVKSSYDVVLKSTQAWGCLIHTVPMLHKCLLKDVKSAHTHPLSCPLLVLSLFLLEVSFFNNWGNIHRNSSSLDWGEKLEFGVHSEIRLGLNKLQHRVPYPCFSSYSLCFQNWY